MNQMQQQIVPNDMLQQQMIYMGPIITLVIGLRFPSGLILYWTVTTIFMIVQQYLILKKDGDKTATSQVK